MRISRGLLFTAAFLGCGLLPVSISSVPTNKTGAGRALVEDNLLSSLSLDIAERIRYLSKNFFVRCPGDVPTGIIDDPKEELAVQFTSAIIADRGGTPRFNCFSTIAWIISGEENYIGFDSKHLLKILSKLNYRPQGKHKIYRISFSGVPISIELGNSFFKSLRPGDVLLFSGPFGYSHTAIYKGVKGKEHKVFEKNGSGCGVRSAYQETSLIEVFEHKLFATITQDSGFDSVTVFRK